MLDFLPGVYMAAFVVSQIAEDEAFERSLIDLPPDVSDVLRWKRDEQTEKMRIEAVAERRHHEMCVAIRSTGFWRF